MPDRSIIKELSKIPGVGRSIAKDLYELGIFKIEDLIGKDPEMLYRQSNELAGCRQDRCLLYVFRCAVYFAETPQERQEKNKLEWWYWKD
ncbi:MAG TPA: helix-hairpin-helix domain-containing protein [Edaphocola sp.]|nr:helix-hairpin-helix domain-containing protein [Edaphocola sp.]